MRNILILVIMVATLSGFKSDDKETGLYDIQIQTLANQPMDLSELKGKKILFVNVASKCGFTPQYAELQKLYDKYKSQLTVVGVPCNQFGGQEPGTPDQIASFCQKNYGVTFPITEKVDVKGANQHPLYKWLTSKSQNGVIDSKVSWNFQKYLVSEDGKLINVFGSRVKPMSDEILTYFN